VPTGVDRAVLEGIYDVMSSPPEGFVVHPKLAKQFETRTKMFREEGEVDWALGEAFAFGSLLLEGTDIRVAGQDSRRGTFSHRHAVLVDNETEADWAPLANLDDDQAKLWIYDSALTEYAGLGFEWGYAATNPQVLVCWEAQFGDFVNGAQIVIDQYLVAAEDKWGITNGLVLLLPHGYEGQGPEHSSARIERVLSACAEDNIQVANATTAGQYFHLLRRQMRRSVRKPLVVFSPKSLLRAKPARSKVEELTTGSFLEVLADPSFAGDRGAVQRVVLASGKVGHDAIAARDARGAPVAVLRVEQLFPWPYDFLAEALAAYPNARELVWLQEEPENMGPWNFVKGKLYEALGDRFSIKRVSRFESGSPATGSKAVHDQEHEMILDQALATA
jgi:2-oxoglutarate dehydrogenase E1 component